MNITGRSFRIYMFPFFSRSDEPLREASVRPQDELEVIHILGIHGIQGARGTSCHDGYRVNLSSRINYSLPPSSRVASIIETFREKREREKEREREMLARDLAKAIRPRERTTLSSATKIRFGFAEADWLLVRAICTAHTMISRRELLARR